MVRHADAPGAVRRLAGQEIVVDHRAGYVRISPHLYNTADENAAAVAALAAISWPRRRKSATPRLQSAHTRAGCESAPGGETAETPDSGRNERFVP
jgi:hypothetical protein